MTLSYVWYQKNNATPDRGNIGFWTSLNDSSVYAKATSYACAHAAGWGYANDTSGDQMYRCSASGTFDFTHYPQLLGSAYAASTARNGWDVQVAVSLDDAGNWDSRSGQNYRFHF